MIPTEGLKDALQAIVDDRLEGSRMILVSNDPVLEAPLVFADLTEPSFDGYAPQTLTGWSSIAETSAGDALVVSPDVTFQNTDTDPADVYCWAIISDSDHILVIERFDDAPLTIGASGTLPMTVAYVYAVTCPT